MPASVGDEPGSPTPNPANSRQRLAVRIKAAWFAVFEMPGGADSRIGVGTTLRRQLFCGNPRFTPPCEGSGQRVVTTLVRV